MTTLKQLLERAYNERNFGTTTSALEYHINLLEWLMQCHDEIIKEHGQSKTCSACGENHK